MAVPNPPFVNTPDQVTRESIRVTYSNNNQSGILGGQIAISTNSGTPGTNTNYPTYNSTGSTTIFSLQPGTVYYVWVRIRNSEGFSGWSTRRSTITHDFPSAPPAPSVSKIGPFSAQVSFSAPSNNGGTPITGYEIYYGSGIPGDSNIISVSSSPATISGLTPGRSYNVQVRALNEWGSGNFSANTVYSALSGVNLKVGGVWKTGVPYVKVAGVWRLAEPWSRSLGVWKRTS